MRIRGKEEFVRAERVHFERRIGFMVEKLMACIKGRRSTRKFKENQITSEERDCLLEAAIWAPSGGNNQTWLFTVIEDQEKLLHLNELVRLGFQTYIPDDDYPGKHGVKVSSAREGYNFYYHAPTLIIASNKPNYENAMADCALAAENIFLMAEAQGLGTCYINQLHWLREDEGVRDYLATLGIPKEHTICLAVAVGYIAEASPVPARKEGTINIVK